jgi:hypothetical protein
MKMPYEALDGKYPVGVDSVPIRHMKDWAGRGCNLLVRSDLEGGTVQPRQWADAAENFNFKTIRPATMPVDDAKDPTLIAVNLPDEPDLSNHWFGRRPALGWPAGIKVFESVKLPDGSTADLVGKEQGNPTVLTGATMALAATVYAQKAAILRGLYPNMPIFGNFAGNAVTSGMEQANYQAFTAAVDWCGSDWYPVDADLAPFPLPIDKVRRYSYQFPARALSRLKAWSNGKPQFAYISCVSQRLNPAKSAEWRWPDVREIECQAWAAICAGAMGIIYFGIQQNPWRSDAISSTIKGDYPTGTAADKAAAQKVADWLPTFNAQLQKFAEFLNVGSRVDTTVAYPAGVVGASWTLAGATGGILSISTNTTAQPAGTFGPCESRIELQRATPTPPIEPVPPIPGPFATLAEMKALADRVNALESRMDGIAAAAKK